MKINRGDTIMTIIACLIAITLLSLVVVGKGQHTKLNMCMDEHVGCDELSTNQLDIIDARMREAAHRRDMLKKIMHED